jgi:hypothetical protein
MPKMAHKVTTKIMSTTSNTSPTGITKKEWNKASHGTDLIQVMRDAVSANQISEILQDMLHADIVTKGGNTRPDYRTRERALTLVMSYTLGTPIQRQEQVNYNMDMNDLNPAELVEKLSESPAMIRKLEEMLAEAKTKAALDI